MTLPLILLFLARATDGITGGNVSVANAYLADITDEEDRSRNFGRMALSGNLGFVLGPALAGLLGATIYGEIIPVTAALAISIIATLIIVFGLKEYDPCVLTRAPEPRSLRKVFGQEHKECFSISNSEKVTLVTVLGIANVPRLLVVYFLVMLGFSFFYIGFPVHAVQQLQWTVTDTGTFFAYLSLLRVMVQGPILARASARFSDNTLAFSGALILTIGFIGLYWDRTAMIYIAATLIALGNGLALGCAAGFVAYLWKGNPTLGIVLALALMVNLIVAAFVGSIVPLTLRRVGIDPAVASNVNSLTNTRLVWARGTSPNAIPRTMMVSV